MRTLLALVCLFACSRPAPKQPPSNMVETPTAEAVEEKEEEEEEEEEEEPSQCARYGELTRKVEACTALSEEARQDLQQWDADTTAAISESGMEDSTPVDEEKLCEEAADHVIKVAKQPCGL